MNLKSLTREEIGDILKELGQPAFRAGQIFTWLHKGVRSYEEMTNLPKNLRQILAEKYPICPPRVVRRQESSRDGTIKYLWELGDGNCVETVLMLPLRQHRLHLHGGGLPHGLCLLRLHTGRTGAAAGAL